EAVDAGAPGARRVGLGNDVLGNGRDELQLGRAQRPRRPLGRSCPRPTRTRAQDARHGRSGDGTAQEHRYLLEGLAATDRSAVHCVTPFLLAISRYPCRALPTSFSAEATPRI